VRVCGREICGSQCPGFIALLCGLAAKPGSMDVATCFEPRPVLPRSFSSRRPANCTGSPQPAPSGLDETWQVVYGMERTVGIKCKQPKFVWPLGVVRVKLTPINEILLGLALPVSSLMVDHAIISIVARPSVDGCKADGYVPREAT